MSKKLIDVLPSLQSFKDNVISSLTNMFNGAEWLNDATSYTKQETIYRLLILKYGDRFIRYDDDNIFINRLVFDLADLMPDIYAKQQVFIRNQLADFLSSVKNRAVIIDSETTNNRNSDSNSKLGNSSSPLNLVINSADEIQQAPITSSNLSNVKLVENYNGNNQQVNYNFVNDLVKTLNADYSLRLNEFMELLGKHFVNVVGSYYRPQQCNNDSVKGEPYRFNNGYLVNEVDYLGTQNQNAINSFNEKLERLSDAVATKQNQLTSGDNITINNNVISAIIPRVDLSNYYNKQEIDNQQLEQNKNITTNSTNIVKVNNKVNKVIDELNNSVLINYKGEFIEGTTAKLGEVWSYDGKMWLCKVDSTTTTPQEGNEWDLLSAPEIDLSNYYTKTQIDQTVNTINGNISDNRNDINILDGEVKTIKNDLGDLGDIVNDNSSKINNKLDTSIFNNYQQSNDNKVNELSTQQQTNTNDISILKNNVNTINDNFNNYYTKTQIDISQAAQDTLINDNYNDLKEKLETNVESINNRFNDYYTKTDLSNYSVVIKAQQFKVSESTKIDNYNDTEIVLTAPQKITNITIGSDGVEKFRTEVRTDGLYLNNLKTQPTKNTEILNNDTVITDLGNNKVMVIAQADIRNYLSSGQDLFNALPDAVKNLTNVSDIEYFEYNFVQILNGKNKVFTNAVGNVAATVYDNRIYLRNENNIAGYIQYIRFKLVYNKR